MNYKPLHYFTQVAKFNSVTRASERLHVTPQTVSGQIHVLEEALGSALFVKSRRGKVLTETSRQALCYAKHFFALRVEVEEAVREHPRQGRSLDFKVGGADAVPKSI